jgi:hypothetical protein
MEEIHEILEANGIKPFKMKFRGERGEDHDED